MNKTVADPELVTGLRQGDPGVVREIYDRFADKVRIWVLANSGTTEEAKDVFQEGIHSMYETVSDPDFRLRSSFEGLLLTICKRYWFGVLRRKKRWQNIRNSGEVTPDIEEADAEVEIMRLEERRDTDRKLAATFSLLSDLCRKLLQRYAQGETPEAIAEALNMSGRNAVYQRRKACADRWKVLMNEAT